MEDALATIGLGPVLLWQGRRVRRTTPVLPEPPGPREGTAGEGPPLRLLLLGDSAALGLGAASQDEALSGRLVAALAPYYRLTWRLVARTGATTRGTWRRLEPEPEADWDVVVTSLGVNDVTGAESSRTWLVAQQELVGRIQARFAPRWVLLSGMPPVHAFPALPQPLRWYLGRKARRFDRALAAWAAGTDGVRHLTADFVDDPDLMASDGFHPGPRGYALWAGEVARTIRALC